MQTLAIVNEKGGTGKTTTAVNLSAALGELGRKVLLVDLDGQAASSRWLGVEEDTSFADALWRGEGLCPRLDVIPGVSLAPGSGKLDSIAHDLRPTQGGQLRKLLAQVAGFDYAVIDCPPSLGNRLIGNALLAASHAIVPVETSILALDGLKILLTTLQDIRDGFGHDIRLAGVLACRYDVRTKLSRFVLTELRRALPGKVFQTVVRENVRMRECPASGQSILTYAPKSHSAEDYRSLAREVAAMSDAGGEALQSVAVGGVESARSPSGGEEARGGDLTEDDRAAVAEMRGQLNAMVRQFASKHGAAARTTPAGAAADQQPEGAAPAPEPVPVDLTEQSPPAEVSLAHPTGPSPAPAAEASLPAPEQLEEADSPADDECLLDNDRLWGLGAASPAPPPEARGDETARDEPSPEDESRRDETAPEDETARDEPSPEDESRGDESRRDETPLAEPGAERDHPPDAPSGETEPPAADEPVPQAPSPADQSAPQEQPDGQHDFPALRRLLRGAADPAGEDQGDGPHPPKEPQEEAPWRRLLRKAGMK